MTTYVKDKVIGAGSAISILICTILYSAISILKYHSIYQKLLYVYTDLNRSKQKLVCDNKVFYYIAKVIKTNIKICNYLYSIVSEAFKETIDVKRFSLNFI